MKRWSSKDLEILAPAVDGRPGDAVFTFTDRYSIYDFGVMPDEIPGKGRASCAMAVTSFEVLARADVPTHFIEQVADDAIRIRLLDVDLDGRSALTGAGGMIPLQVVYRNALPRESSVHRRVAAGRLDPALVPERTHDGSPWLREPMVEFTTKFEQTDRFITRAEAATVGRVTGADLDAVTAQVLRAARALTAHAAGLGLELVDGKAEFGFDAERRPMLIDHAGTPDENRFYYQGFPLCKELLRSLHPDLRALVQQSIRNGLPRSAWEQPARLTPDVVEATAEVYTALAELWTTEDGLAPQRVEAAIKGFLAATAEGPVLAESAGLD